MYSMVARLGTLQAALMTGGLIGIQLCPKIAERYGYTTVFAVATVMIHLSVLYSLFFLQESIIPSEVRIRKRGNRCGRHESYELSIARRLREIQPVKIHFG